MLQIGPKVAILHKNTFFLFNQKYEALQAAVATFIHFKNML
jgi:hypothetical protein